jgi:S1-C subfamily serine protease
VVDVHAVPAPGGRRNTAGERRWEVPTLAPLLEQVTPAVVNIAVLSRSPEQDNPMLQDPFFRRFFGLPEADHGAADRGHAGPDHSARRYVFCRDPAQMRRGRRRPSQNTRLS